MIYRKVFGVYPDDTMKNSDMVKEVKNEADIGLYWELKDDIKGIACEFPLLFLEEEDISKQKYFEMSSLILPTHMFT